MNHKDVGFHGFSISLRGLKTVQNRYMGTRVKLRILSTLHYMEFAFLIKNYSQTRKLILCKVRKQKNKKSISR